MRWFYPRSLYIQVLRVAWPLIVSQGAFTLMLFFDRVFLANYSQIAIQAALPAGIFAFTLCSGFMSIASYTNTFVAQFYGAKNYQECSRSTAQGIIFSLLCAPLLLVMIFPGRWILAHCGHADAVLNAELPYFTILMIGNIATPLNAAISSYYTGQGRTRLTMLYTIIGNATNLLLDYLLIFGKFGFPEMGIRGAAIATAISAFVCPIALLIIYFSQQENNLFQTRRTFSYDHRLFWRMIRFSLPAGIHLALDIASFSLFVLLTGRMGSIALSASNIALSINTLAFMPLIGIGIATSILVGQAQGNNNSHEATIHAHASLHIALIYMSIAGAMFVLIPDAFISLFARGETNPEDTRQVFVLGRKLLILLTIWGVADAFNLVYGSALKGAGDTRYVMIYSVAAAWLMLVPGQLIIIEFLKKDIITAWWWTGAYISILALGFTSRFFGNKWKSIDVMGR